MTKLLILLLTATLAFAAPNGDPVINIDGVVPPLQINLENWQIPPNKGILNFETVLSIKQTDLYGKKTPIASGSGTGIAAQGVTDLQFHNQAGITAMLFDDYLVGGGLVTILFGAGNKWDGVLQVDQNAVPNTTPDGHYWVAVFWPKYLNVDHIQVIGFTRVDGFSTKLNPVSPLP